MATQPKVAFVAGVNGISGHAIVEHLLRSSEDDWSRIIISTRSPLKTAWNDPRLDFLELDFLDSVDTTIARMKPLCQDVTHAFFTAYVHVDDFAKLPEYNIPLFRNFLNAIDTVAHQNLQRVCLQTGGKHYGVHLGPTIMCPAPEDVPRYDDRGENFYFGQEDVLFDLHSKRSWSYSIIRPKAIIGYSPSKNGISETISLALYFLICRELGEEARWNGNYYYYHGAEDQSYAPSLADLSVWAMTHEHTKNQAFNHNNGDVIVWKYIFPKLAAYFDATPEYPDYSAPGAKEAPESAFSMVEWAKDKREVWHRICDKYGGKKEAFDWATWDALDWVSRMNWLSLISIGKARKFGWTRHDDTFECWLKTYKVYEMAGVLPPHHKILGEKSATNAKT